MQQHLCAFEKSQTLAAITLFGYTKILYTLIRMSNTALAVAVPYPGKVTQISHNGQWRFFFLNQAGLMEHFKMESSMFLFWSLSPIGEMPVLQMNHEKGNF